MENTARSQQQGDGHFRDILSQIFSGSPALPATGGGSRLERSGLACPLSPGSVALSFLRRYWAYILLFVRKWYNEDRCKKGMEHGNEKQ